MKSNDYSILKKLFPFTDVSDNELKKIYDTLRITRASFSKGDVIFNKEHYEKRIGFVTEGECRVLRKRGCDSSLSLNTIGKYGSFGILSLFTPNAEYPTDICASTKTTVIFIEADDMLRLVAEYPQISLAVIKFLAKKIAFLNGKLATFSSKCVEDRVASYLYSQYQKNGVTLNVSMAALSRELDVGRASLYRIISSLEEKGIIKTEPKKIIFIDPQGLERILK